MSEQNFFYVIPAKLAEEGNLTKAILFGLISSLTNKQGYCWASNEFLANKIGRKNIKTISNHINELKKDGWIDVEIKTKEGNARKIWILMGGMVKKHKTYGKNPQEGYSKNPQDSNINKSNIKSNTLEASSRGQLKFPKKDYDEIIKEYERLTGIKHSGEEYKPLQQAIKTMFKSGRTKDQIIKCMHFINNRPEECWANWNINTIKKQLPRFLSGKF